MFPWPQPAGGIEVLVISSRHIILHISMEGRKGHNSALLFKLQLKHLYIRTYYFVTFIILIYAYHFRL